MAITDELRKRGLLDVAEDIARGLHLTVEDMFSKGRHSLWAQARRSFYAYLWALGWSYPMIARLVGRDHTTVLAALRAP